MCQLINASYGVHKQQCMVVQKLILATKIASLISKIVMPFNSNIKFNIENNLAKKIDRSVGVCERGTLL